MHSKNNLFFILTLLFFSSIVRSQNDSSLINAIKNEKYEIAKKLINNKTNLDEQDNGNATPFMWAIYKNQIELVKLLQKNGANVNIKGIITDNEFSLNIGSPLAAAALKGDLELVKFLVIDCDIPANDTELDIYGDNAWNALYYLAYRKDFKEIADFLISKGADVHLEDESDIGDSINPLFHSCAQGNTSYVTYLISKGADPAATSYARNSQSNFTRPQRTYQSYGKLSCQSIDSCYYSRKRRNGTMVTG